MGKPQTFGAYQKRSRQPRLDNFLDRQIYSLTIKFLFSSSPPPQKKKKKKKKEKIFILVQFLSQRCQNCCLSMTRRRFTAQSSWSAPPRYHQIMVISKDWKVVKYICEIYVSGTNSDSGGSLHQEGGASRGGARWPQNQVWSRCSSLSSSLLSLSSSSLFAIVIFALLAQ